MARVIILAATLCANLVVAIVLHEAGHALSALLLGWHVEAMGLGNPASARWTRVRETCMYLGPCPWGGVSTWASWRTLFPTRLEMLAWLAGGPAANILGAGMAILVLPEPHGLLVSVSQLLVALANLLPWNLLGKGWDTDGRQLWVVLRGHEQSPRGARVWAGSAAAIGMQRMGRWRLATHSWAWCVREDLRDGRLARASRRARRALVCSTRSACSSAQSAALAALALAEFASGQSHLARTHARNLARLNRADVSARLTAVALLVLFRPCRRPGERQHLHERIERLWRRASRWLGLEEWDELLGVVQARSRPGSGASQKGTSNHGQCAA